MLCTHLKHYRRISQGLEGLLQLNVNFKRHVQEFTIHLVYFEAYTEVKPA